MPRTLESPVARFPGTVTFYDPLTAPMVLAFEQAAAWKSPSESPTLSEAQAAMLPYILTCIESFHLDKVPEHPVADKNFPFSPRLDTARLIRWLFDSVNEIYLGEIAPPLA